MRYKSICVLALSLVTLFCTTVVAQPNCSTQTLVGTWVATSQGTVFPTPTVAVPGAALALVSIGYDGSLSVLMTGNVGGRAGDAPPMTGTTTVNPDCTGSFSASAATGGTLTEQFVVLDHGNEIWTIAVGGITGYPAVWQCHWKRLSHVPLPTFELSSNCSADMIRGTWVGTYNGVTLRGSPPVPVPTGILLIGGVDYQGNLSGTFTSSMGGQVGTGQYAGSLTMVKPNCTGTWTWTLKGMSGQAVERLVILDNGNEIWTLPTQGVLGMPVGLGRHIRLSAVAPR